MVDGGGLENRWTKVSRVRILLPPPVKCKKRPVCFNLTHCFNIDQIKSGEMAEWSKAIAC